MSTFLRKPSRGGANCTPLGVLGGFPKKKALKKHRDPSLKFHPGWVEKVTFSTFCSSLENDPSCKQA